MTVRCPLCQVEWDIDYDPPKCTDPDHPHYLKDDD